MRRTTSATLAILVLAGSGGVARGTLVSLADPVFGPDSTTLDTATQLVWLDLTFSTNRSFNDVSSELGPTGDFAGFRYATLAEVDALYLNAGFSATDGVFRAIDYPVVQYLASLLGYTYSDSRQAGGQALVFDTVTAGSRRISGFNFEKPPFANADKGYALGLAWAGTSSISQTTARDFTGSFLIRAVPELSAFPLLLAACGLMAVRCIFHYVAAR